MFAHFISKLPTYTWEAKEIVRELDERPHLLTRIEVRGTFFPHMAREPFMRIVTSEETVARTWFVDVCDDNTCLRGYFGQDLPERGILEFGYGNDLMGQVDFDLRERAVATLERQRLPEEIVVVSSKLIEQRMRSD